MQDECTLCNDTIMKSSTVRPNVATFECGHEFHLSCILSFSQENLSKICPTCNEFNSATINLGDDRLIAIQTLIESRRMYKNTAKKGFFSWFQEKSIPSMVKSGTSLETMKLKGMTPEDIIEHGIDWETMVGVYKTSALLNFGFRWHHMITMGFQPNHFKVLDWHQMSDVLKLSATDMLKTSISIRQLADLKIDIAHLHQMGFRLKEFKQIGGNCETMALITKDLSEIKTYLNPQGNDWEELGFTKDGIKKNGWDSNSYTPHRKSRPINIVKSGGFVF